MTNITIDKFQFKRGNEANVPSLDSGEPFISEDSHILFVGTPAGNIEFAKKSDVDANTTSLAESATKINNRWVDVTDTQFGAKGDGVTDDTTAIQNAINYCLTNHVDLFIPAKTFLVTAPLVINDAFNTSSSYGYFKIFGTGSNLSLDHMDYFKSRILGKNIPATRGLLEVIGNGITNTVQIQLDSIALIASTDVQYSNADNSAALVIGDAEAVKVDKCLVVGYHGMLLRSGYDYQTTGQIYCFRNSKFSNSKFYGMGAYGFSVADYQFVGGAKQSPADSILFDTCYFVGTTMVSIYEGNFVSCMWQVKNFPNKTSFVYPSNSTIQRLAGETVNFKNAFYGVTGVYNLIGCYFEDYQNGVVAQPYGGSEVVINATGTHFSSATNYRDVSNNLLMSDSAVLTKNTVSGSGLVRAVNISECYFNSNYNFNLSEVVDNAAINLNIDKCNRKINVDRTNKQQATLTNYTSCHLDIGSIYHSPFEKEYTFKTTVVNPNTTNFQDVITGFNQLLIDRPCRVVAMELIWTGSLPSDTALVFAPAKNGTVLQMISKTGTSATTYTSGTQNYTVVNYPNHRNTEFARGDFLSFQSFISSATMPSATTITIFAKVRLEY